MTLLATVSSPADAVVSGQSWHWVDPVAGAAKAATVLHPLGRLAVFWNVQQPPLALAEAVAAVMPNPAFARAVTQVGPDAYAPLCDKASAGIRQHGLFTEPDQWRFDWEQVYTRDEWLDQLPTTGAFTRLPPAALADVLAGVGAVLDDMGGSVTVRCTTAVVTAVRSG